MEKRDWSHFPNFRSSTLLDYVILFIAIMTNSRNCIPQKTYTKANLSGIVHNCLTSTMYQKGQWETPVSI